MQKPLTSFVSLLLAGAFLAGCEGSDERGDVLAPEQISRDEIEGAEPIDEGGDEDSSEELAILWAEVGVSHMVGVRVRSLARMEADGANGVTIESHRLWEYPLGVLHGGGSSRHVYLDSPSTKSAIYRTTLYHDDEQWLDLDNIDCGYHYSLAIRHYLARSGSANAT